jgi:uncharacterized protein DUF5818
MATSLIISRIRKLARAALLLTVFVFGSVQIALGHAPASSPQTPSTKGTCQLGSSQGSTKKNERLHLQGVLVEGGAECQRFRADNGTLYTLEGDLHGFRTGDRVKITGVIPEVSHCMQDTPLRVISIERAKLAQGPRA